MCIVERPDFLELNRFLDSFRSLKNMWNTLHGEWTLHNGSGVETKEKILLENFSGCMTDVIAHLDDMIESSDFFRSSQCIENSATSRSSQPLHEKHPRHKTRKFPVLSYLGLLLTCDVFCDPRTVVVSSVYGKFMESKTCDYFLESKTTHESVESKTCDRFVQSGTTNKTKSSFLLRARNFAHKNHNVLKRMQNQEITDDDILLISGILEEARELHMLWNDRPFHTIEKEHFCKGFMLKYRHLLKLFSIKDSLDLIIEYLEQVLIIKSASLTTTIFPEIAFLSFLHDV